MQTQEASRQPAAVTVQVFCPFNGFLSRKIYFQEASVLCSFRGMPSADERKAPTPLITSIFLVIKDFWGFYLMTFGQTE